jgi:tetratricopeptide (TPR) repeat protein
MQQQTIELNAFLALLNEEADIGARALPTLLTQPITSWPQLLEEHPQWRRFGTFDALLSEAHAEIDNDAHRALAITSFVLPYAEHLPDQPGSDLLAPLLLGTACKEHANALYELEHYPEALAAVRRALDIFASSPALIVDRASALLTFAQVSHALHDTAVALEAVRDAAGIFDAHAEQRRYLTALEVCGQILMDQRDYDVAYDVYRTARTVAERLEDAFAIARLENNLGVCAVYLDEIDEATRLLTRAFVYFESAKMSSALQRTIWSIARMKREKEELDEALEALHGVYAEFLHRGLLRSAAKVLVELGDVVAEMTGDVGYAHEMCRRLAETMGEHDVPSDVRAALEYRNLRAAVEFLRQTTQDAPSVATLRAAFARVRQFLELLTGSPSTAFAVPA